ncbi:MAG: hypothetical protein M1822_009406 [Bathelium mastoideum]|nr:MAG: hypothetical protein M1822_009406 [Bathelium mastoideum]
MSSSPSNVEAAGPSANKGSTSELIDLKILSPSAEVRNGLVFTSLPVSTTVGQLKERIRAELPSRPANDRQRLIYRGRVMADESQTMGFIFGEDAVKQQREHTLHLVIPDSVTQPGNAPHSTASQRQTQTPANPFQNIPPPGHSSPPVPQPNPFRNVAAGQRPASVPPMQGVRPAHAHAPNVPPIPGLHQHMAHIHAVQQQIQQLQQRAGGPNGGVPNNEQLNNHQSTAEGQQGESGQSIHQGQPSSHSTQGHQNGQPAMAPGGQVPASGIPGGVGNFTRSGVGPHGESWTFTVNTTTTVPHGPHMQPQMPLQMPLMPPFPFGQVPGQNPQFGPLPPMGLPHPPMMNSMQVPRTLNMEAQVADMERSVEDLQRRLNNLNPASGEPSVREEGERIGNDLRDARLQLQSLRARANHSINDLNPAGTQHPGSSQILHNGVRPSMDNSMPSNSVSQPGQQNGPHRHDSTNSQNNSASIENSSTAPTVYLLSSPTGPEALLLSPAGTWASPGASHQFVPFHPDDTHQQRMRGLYPNLPQPPMGNMIPQVYNTANRSFVGGHPPGQGGNAAQVNAGTLSTQQQPASLTQHQTSNQNQPGAQGQQQPQQVARVPLFPNQQPRNVVAPGQAAQDGNAPNAAAPAQAQVPPLIQEQQNLGAIAGHLWVLVRIVGFLWLFFGGSNVGYVRPFVIGAVAFLAYAAQQQGPIRRFGERIREHVEGLLRPQEGAAQRRPGQERQDRGQVQGQTAPDRTASSQGRPNHAATPPSRVPRTRMEAQRVWARAQLLNAERAIALFVASLWPGVGERHVEARERERRQREEEEARQRREQEEREKRLKEEAEARVEVEQEARRTSEATAETVGLRSPPVPGYEEGLRERRPAIAEEAQVDQTEQGSSQIKGKGKEPVRAEDGVTEGNTTGADPVKEAFHANNEH